MGAVEALAILAQVLGSATNLMAQAQQISTLISTAQSQGRTTFTAEEWSVVQGADAAARAQLVAALQKALAA